MGIETNDWTQPGHGTGRKGGLPRATLHGLSDDPTDVDQVQLPPLVLIGRVDADGLAVEANPRMGVAAELLVVPRRLMEVAQRNHSAGGDMAQEDVLVAILVGRPPTGAFVQSQPEHRLSAAIAWTVPARHKWP